MKINDRPVVVFLIPFASREIKSKWEIACAHLRQTLKSIHNSTNGSFRVIVAGHEAPDLDVRFDSRFYLLTVNQPIPSRENYPRCSKAGQANENRSRLGLREVNMQPKVCDET